MKKSIVLEILVLMSIFLVACGNSNSKSSALSSNKASVSKKLSSNKTSSDKKSSSSAIKVNSTKSSSSSSVSTSSSSTSSIKKIDFQEASNLIQKGGFTDFNAEEVYQYHELSNGGFEVDTYSGAKGEDIFTLTPSTDGTVKITAVYGTLDGGSFSVLPDQSTYGPTSATVQR
ncbi:hypothetical protein LAP9571_02868 [Lactiplantibacillus plantarum]|uniref:hypothetical protein n=1 Tax=Lactiplantibacillus plantarum TaxID=1590 RepID=UPI00106D2FEB|nr:hypothetical protein [Lactiplantibacillus plantarum]VFI63646.1 hypothetical protein LAP9571_02868 [Lactiplantibacillus plantarum]VFI64343.1 hypothetical protein LAP9492_03074 [Lactiplantibacillus plantarum]